MPYRCGACGAVKVRMTDPVAKRSGLTDLHAEHMFGVYGTHDLCGLVLFSNKMRVYWKAVDRLGS